MRIKKFNESRDGIDWKYFDEFKSLANKYRLQDNVFKDFKIDGGTVEDILQDLRDNYYYEITVSEKFYLDDRENISHIIEIRLRDGSDEITEIESPKDHLRLLKSEISFIQDLDSMCLKFKSFFDMHLTEYTHKSKPVYFSLKFHKNIKEPNLIRNFYLAYFKLANDRDKNLKSIIPKQMAEKSVDLIIDYLSREENDCLDYFIDKIKISYHQGGIDVSGPGGFHIFMDGDMVTRESIPRSFGFRDPNSYIDWDVVCKIVSDYKTKKSNQGG